MSAVIPDRARVVVIGGGVIGTSVAYHLTRLGWTDVLLLEQGRLSSGTTWHAAGLVGQLRASESGTRLVQYSAALYASLEAETGLSTGWKMCGGLTVARTEDRMTQLRRTAANAVAYDLDCELLTPAQVAERCPILRTDDLVGGIWLPQDGKANPTDLTSSLARGARMGGARIVEKARVVGVDLVAGPDRPRATGVSYDGPDGPGHVEAEVVVNCAGQWAKALGDLAGVTVPLHSAEHFYVVTEPFAGSAQICRCCATPTATRTSRRRSAAWSSAGSSPRRSRGCPPTRSRTPSSSSCSRRTGSTSRC
ncbi:MAG: FAD-dependent oxidoreductase [Nocardioidaceae bacterium]|nr:FAD-dependent oxidoreductase [Nocardioidaceae bacterium]